MSLKDDVRILALIQAKQIRKSVGCGKLQYTPFGICMECNESEACQQLRDIDYSNQGGRQWNLQ